MPHNGMNFKGEGSKTHHSTYRANGLVNGCVPGTGLINGAVVHNGFPAAATRTSERTPSGTPNSTQPQCMVNGYINRGYKGKSTKAPPPRTFCKQTSPISTATDSSAAGRVSSGDIPGGILVNGATSLDTSPSSVQMAPEPSLSAAPMNQRRRRKFKKRKRDTHGAWPEIPKLPLMAPPEEEEDWEHEIKEVTLSNWETMTFGVHAYGPEDVLHFTLRDLTLLQRDSVDPPVTANYRPSIHHPHPVKWSCYKICPEPDQFTDAD